jgi:hypothetical protein
MTTRFVTKVILVIVTSLVLSLPAPDLDAQDSPFRDLTENQQRAEDILRETVGFETTVERPEETRKALQAMANRLLEVGFPSEDVQDWWRAIAEPASRNPFWSLRIWT